MTQFRTFEFEADDSTFELNQRVLDIMKPGLYHGFDAVLGAGLNLILSHATSGVSVVNENELLTNKRGMLITKQGVVIREDADKTIPIEVGDPIHPRIDLIIAEHLYTQVTGGQPAVYMVIKGTPSATPVAPALTNTNRQTIIGELYVPANMSGLDDPNVEFEKSIQPDYSGNGSRARLEALEAFQASATTELANRLKKSLNLSDLPSKSAARGNLQLGNHVTYNFKGSGGDLGSENNVARGNHVHSALYEPKFTKKTAFNKNFGTASSTVCQGNDSRLSNSRKCNNTFDSASTSRSNLGLGNHVTHNYAGINGLYGNDSKVARGDHRHDASHITQGILADARIPNMSYQKLTSGYVRLYAYMRTYGQRITYSGTYGGIYIRSDNKVAIGETSGASNVMLYVNGSIRANTDRHVAGSGSTETSHDFRGLGTLGSYPKVLNVVGGTGLDADYNCVGINVQLTVHNTIAGRYKYLKCMSNFGETAGYIANSAIVGSGSAIELYGVVATHAPSDKRLKENVAKTKLGIKDLMKLNIVDYNFIGAEETRQGMIAQDTMKIMPLLVDDPDERNKAAGIKAGQPNYEYMSIDYNKLIPILVKAVQEQQIEINKLKAK